MNSDPRYELAWRDYRKRRYWFWGVFIGYVPGIVLVGLILEKRFQIQPPLGTVALVWMVACVVVGNYAIRFRCPRCHELFFSNVVYNSFSKKCLHCALPLWAPNDPNKK